MRRVSVCKLFRCCYSHENLGKLCCCYCHEKSGGGPALGWVSRKWWRFRVGVEVSRKSGGGPLGWMSRKSGEHFSKSKRYSKSKRLSESKGGRQAGSSRRVNSCMLMRLAVRQDALIALTCARIYHSPTCVYPSAARVRARGQGW